MRKKGILFLILTCFVVIGTANGAGRSISNSTHQDKPQNARTTISIRSNGQGATKQPTTTTPKRSKTRQIISSRSGLLSLPNTSKRVVSRAATTNDSSQSFGVEYENCRNAYFTCMDQFCANIDDSYRRCICSSRLSEIKQKETALSQTSDSLNNFHDFNLDVITKSTAEVNAMTHATGGEQMATLNKDNSNSNKKLSAIGDVLAKAKNKSLSTAGTLDAGGDITSIWTTTNLANGANIANLTGEPLYNAVNAQCSNMVSSQCPSSILHMVISAYGMYIENDCSALANNLSKKKNSASAAIRETGREIGTARLANYDAHNSLSINSCINSVRNDLTANSACGPDFVHCLDVTGLYLNIDTGEPIYGTNFYNLANQISLSGNILNNQTNHMIVSALNNKKSFAKNSLDKCRDLSGDIWDEFMRQAIIEIHQKQQEKIKSVKTECLGIVNQCYDQQTNSLKDFSNVNDATLLGLTLETVEDLCREKLNTCSNLYGGGPTGLESLVNAMYDITNQRIVAECQDLLKNFGNDLCAVQSTDTIHSYPYTCRVYAPGDQQYATISHCNTDTANSAECGNDYINSLYQRFVHYAMQVCIRPSEYETFAQNGELEIPTLILQDINIVMDKMRISMGQELSKECERLGGIWITTPYTDTSIPLQEQFYTETGTNKKWGYCKAPPANNSEETYTITFNNVQSTISNGANITMTVTYGETMPNITPPTCTNHRYFTGYYTQPDSNGNNIGIRYYDQNGTALRTWDIRENTTLYPHCNSYQISTITTLINP